MISHRIRLTYGEWPRRRKPYGFDCTCGTRVLDAYRTESEAERAGDVHVYEALGLPERPRGFGVYS